MATRPGSRRRGRRRGSSSQNLTTADLIVLGLLSERPMRGYELIQEYERQEVKDWAAVSRPHVYYALQKLHSLTLVAPVNDQMSSDAREKSVFAVTKKGQKALASALGSKEWAIRREPTPFTTWLGLSIHASHLDVNKILLSRRNYLEREIAREKETLVMIKNDTSVRAAIGAKMVALCIKQMEIELEWLDESF